MERHRPLSGYAAFLCLLMGLGAGAAQPSVEGVGNFHQVDDHVYRGAQPTPEGFRSLAKLGIKIVVDLREPGGRSRTEEKLVTSDGMRYVGVPFDGDHAPTGANVIKVLKVLEDRSTGPVFVHCRRGADRTGTVIACYRIDHDHWSNSQALAEAKSFGMSRLERGMRQFVLSYQPLPPKIGSPVPTER